MASKPKSNQNSSATNGLRFAPTTAPTQNASASSAASAVPPAPKPRRGLWFAEPASAPRSEPKSEPRRQPQYAWEMTLEEFQQRYFPELCAKPGAGVVAGTTDAIERKAA